MTIERLYKYGHINEYSKDLFTSGKIWLAAPPRLNDPFECRPWLTLECNEDQFVEKVARILHKQKPFMTQDEARVEAAAMHAQGRHRDPKVEDAFRRDIVSTFEKKIGLYCLSRVPDSILMWSHYGCQHEGYCLEFEASDRTAVFGEAQPVIYSDSYPIVNYFTTSEEKLIELTLLTKYTSWAYEQEWRIVDHKSGPGPRHYPPDLLKSVIFGLRMSEHNKELIRAWISKRDHIVRFFEAIRNEQKFSIDLREIT